MNKAILIGNLARDPEMRTGASGVPVCNFTLAVNRRFADQNGNRQADFINVVTFKKNAENCSRYLAKGRKCGVVGSIQTRTYDAQDGTKRYVTEIVADEVEFLGQPAGQAQRGDAYEPPEMGGVSDAEVRSQMGVGEETDELPF